MIREIRETLRILYVKYDTWLLAAGKFMLALSCFLLIRSSMGQFELLNNLILLLILALAASFLPLNAIVLFSVLLILGHFYTISISALAVGGGLLLMILLLYFGLAQRQALALILTPLLLTIRTPLLVPIAFGLMGTPFAGFGMAAGTIGYYGLRTIVAQAALMKPDSSMAFQERLLWEMQTMLQALTSDSEMVLAVLALGAVLLVVYGVHCMEIRYAWQMAVGTGILVYLGVEAFGIFVLEVPYSILMLAIDCAVSVLAGMILQIFFFDLDYRRTEKLRFEDDEYYYYVTAVPKRKQERTVDKWTQ